MVQVTIERPDLADVAAIARVHVESWHETYRGLIPDDIIDSLTFEKRFAFWRNVLTENDVSGLLVARDPSVGIIGFIDVGSARTVAEFADGELFALYLLKNWHGRGLGRRLLTAGQTQARDFGLAALGLWVVRGNTRAERFYTAVGVIPVVEKSGRGFIESGYRMVV